MAHASPKPERADRLHAIIAKVSPAAHAQHAASGAWPRRPGDERPERFERRIGATTWQVDKSITAEDAAADAKNIRPLNRSAAPYEIEQRPDGSRRVKVYAEDGGVYVGNGDDLDAAIEDLERKLGLKEGK